MKLRILFLLTIALSFQINVQGQNDIVIGKIDSIESSILNENRKLMIHVPSSASNAPYSKKVYPVIYVLDGDAHFKSVVGLVEHLSYSNLPEMMVVAIPNTNRTRDLTPSKAEPNPPMVTPDMAEESGGGRDFMSFMEKELFPYIENNYPTAPYRLLIGHSLGGLYAMDVLHVRPDLFDSYIAIDPSMWYDDEKLLTSLSSSNLKDSKFNKKALYMGIANTLENGMDTTSVKKAKGPMVSHINAIFKTRDLLQKESKSNVKFAYKYYENESHGSAPLITTYDGLRFIFDFYEFEIQFQDVMAPNTDVVDRMKAHYKIVTETLGYKNRPDEYMVNGMGYQLMEMGKMDLAKQFFEMNIEYYPRSFNVYDSYGDYYLAVEDKENARKYFEQALAIEENPGSRKKLEELKSN